MNSLSLRKTRPIGKGSRLAVIAPSSPFDRAAFERGVVRLRTRYEVVYDEALFSKQGYLAGDDARRLSELNRALDDDSIDFLVAARGGFGATRLLPSLDFARVEKASKVIVGFSDVTALHALWQRVGLQSIHGPMVCALGDEGESGDARFARWVEVVEGKAPPSFEKLESFTGGSASGVLIGGNLSVLCSLLGTPYAPSFENAVVLIEDVGERPYRIDRMLTQLMQNTSFGRAAAVIVGHFTESKTGADGVSVNDVLRERLGSLSIPVVAGVPSGHVDENFPLRFGVTVHVNSERGVISFEHTL